MGGTNMNARCRRCVPGVSFRLLSPSPSRPVRERERERTDAKVGKLGKRGAPGSSSGSARRRREGPLSKRSSPTVPRDLTRRSRAPHAHRSADRDPRGRSGASMLTPEQTQLCELYLQALLLAELQGLEKLIEKPDVRTSPRKAHITPTREREALRG